MRIIKNLCAAVGAAGMLLAGLGATAAAAAPASASAPAAMSRHSLPKVQTAGMVAGWHRVRGSWKIRPGTISFGAEYGIGHIRWTSWTSKRAWGKGTLDDGLTQAPTQVKVHLWNVHRHSGPGRYFKDLKYSGRHSAFLHINGGVWA
jgi:hypothetical protein